MALCRILSILIGTFFCYQTYIMTLRVKHLGWIILRLANYTTIVPLVPMYSCNLHVMISMINHCFKKLF